MRALSAEGVLSLKPTLIMATTAAGPAATLDQLQVDRHRGDWSCPTTTTTTA